MKVLIALILSIPFFKVLNIYLKKYYKKEKKRLKNNPSSTVELVKLKSLILFSNIFFYLCIIYLIVYIIRII